MLIPEILDLDKSDYEILIEHRALVAKLGISFNKFGKSSVKIIEIPALIQKSNSTKLLRDVIEELEEISQQEESMKIKEVSDDTIATMACHSSIRGGMQLSYEQIKHLVKDLLSCENPYSCPHGRPIIWKLSKNELEKKFKRP